MRKSKFRQLENRFFVLQKAEESIDIQNYDEYSKIWDEYTNLLNEWSFFDYIFANKEESELKDRISRARRTITKRFEEENKQFKEWGERLLLF